MGSFLLIKMPGGHADTSEPLFRCFNVFMVQLTVVFKRRNRYTIPMHMLYYTMGIMVIAGIALWSAWGFFSSKVEQTEYTVLKKMDSYEIREYPAHIVAETTVQGAYDESLTNGFRILAGYIFGDNTQKASIAMTAPVVAEQKSAAAQRIAMTAPVLATTEGSAQIISFSMPRTYTMDTLPTPRDPRIKIVMKPARKYAASGFSWYRSEAQIKRYQAKLLSALARDGILPQGNPVYAGYNAPWTPPWMMRNEVLVQITDTNAHK